MSGCIATSVQLLIQVLKQCVLQRGVLFLGGVCPSLSAVCYRQKVSILSSVDAYTLLVKSTSKLSLDKLDLNTPRTCVCVYI